LIQLITLLFLLKLIALKTSFQQLLYISTRVCCDAPHSVFCCSTKAINCLH